MMINGREINSRRDLLAHYREVNQRLMAGGYAAPLPEVPAPPIVPEPEPEQRIDDQPALTVEQRIAETILLAQKMLARYPLLSKVVIVRRSASRCFAVPERDLIAPCREPWCTVPRQIAMAIATLITNKSRGEVGYFFGGRDRSTVWHAVQKYKVIVARVRDTMTTGESHG